jgi:hypothetical protein
MFLVCRVKSLAFSERRSISSEANNATTTNVVSNISMLNNDSTQYVDNNPTDLNTGDLIPDIKEAIENSVSLLIRKVHEYDQGNNPENLDGLEKKLHVLKSCISHVESNFSNSNQHPNKQR